MLSAAYTDLKPGCETQITQGRGEVVIKVSRQAESESIQKGRNRRKQEEAWTNTNSRENKEQETKEQVTQRIKNTNSEDAAADADKVIIPKKEQQKTGETLELTTIIEKKEELIEPTVEHATDVQGDAKMEIQVVKAAAVKEVQAAETDQEVQTRSGKEEEKEQEPLKQGISIQESSTCDEIECSCTKCNDSKDEQQTKQRSVNIVKRISQNMQWPVEVGQMKILFGLNQKEAIRAGKVSIMGCLAKVQLGNCRIKFEEDVNDADEVTVIRDACNLVYGIGSGEQQCEFKKKIRIRLTSRMIYINKINKVVKGERVIDCTDPERTSWIMQGTDWAHYQVDSWMSTMEEMINEIETIYGVQLEWQRQKDSKYMTMEELLCPIMANITPDTRKEARALFEDNSDYEDDEDNFRCCTVEGRTILRSWIKEAPKPEKAMSDNNTMRLLMWNPENLAQRLDLDNAVSKGKKTRLNSPPLCSVREKWAYKIQMVDPEFIIYNEASLPGADTKKRTNARTVVREAEEFHSNLGYELVVGFEGRGHASHGGAIAVKRGTVVTHVVYGFSGGREEQGRVLALRVSTEEQEFESKTVNGIWIVQMYMHNSGEEERRKMMRAYGEWQETHGEPVIIGSDTNSIVCIESDISMHTPHSLQDKLKLSDTLNLETGEPIPEAGLEKVTIFLKSRAEEMGLWQTQCKLKDACERETSDEDHTCNFAWMRWFAYAKKHQEEWKSMCPVAPCITGRIDRFLVSEDVFEINKIEAFNGLKEGTNSKGCRMLRGATDLSDHAQLAVEVRMKVKLIQGATMAFVNDMHVIKRTPEEQDRHDRTASRIEADHEEQENEEQGEAESDQEVNRGPDDVVKEKAVINSNRWKRITRSAQELKVSLKRMFDGEECLDKTRMQEYNRMRDPIKETLQESLWLTTTEEDHVRELAEYEHTQKLIKELLKVASSLSLWLRNQTRLRNLQSKLNVKGDTRQVVQERTKNRMSVQEKMCVQKEPLMPGNISGTLKIIWDAVRGNMQCKALLENKRFGMLSAIHYMRCTYTQNSQVKALLKYKRKGDPEEDYRIVTEKIVNCMKERQIKKVQAGEEKKLKGFSTTEAIDQEKRQLEVIDNKILRGEMDRETLEQMLEGHIMQSEFSEIESDRRPRRLPKHMLPEINQCVMSDREMDKIKSKTTPKRTTRIRGNVALGNWTGAKEDKNGKMTGENVRFLESDFEDDILVDTGCSYTIVSLAWLLEYCKKHGADIGSTLIRYPDNYRAPNANTASEGCTVQGVGFARIKLSLVTLQDCKQLEWNHEGLQQGGGATTVELDTYVHVFENMGSPFLLGMPFTQEFISSIDFEENRLRLRGEKGENREVPIHPSMQLPMRPVMVCTKEEVHLEAGGNMHVESYTVGVVSFPRKVDFNDSTDINRWTGCDTGGDAKLEYSLEAFDEGTRLHRPGFEVYGIAGRNMQHDQLADPIVKIQGGRMPVVIPAGTPIAFLVQRCQSIPTYRYSRELGYKMNLEDTPDRISQMEQTRETDVIIAVPSREMQEEYELQAAHFLESTIRESIEGYRKQEEMGSAKAAEKAMNTTKLLEELRSARDTHKQDGDTSKQKKLREVIEEKSQERRGQWRQAIKYESQIPKGSSNPDKMAKLLIQMIWHLKSVSRKRKQAAFWRYNVESAKKLKDNEHEFLTAHIETEGDSEAIKAVLRELRSELQKEKWKQWRKEHRDVASVHALSQEIQHGAENMNEEGKVFQIESDKAHFAKANEEMEELYKMLMDDTADEDNKMAAIMEQPVAVQEFFQPKDAQGKLRPRKGEYDKRKHGEHGYDAIDPKEVIGLLSQHWQDAIRKACEMEVDDNGVEVEDTDRVNRMATYMMMVDVSAIKQDSDKVKMLFEYILKREPFYNINPNNPPRFKGPDFDYVRLKEGETPISHQERRIPPAALSTVLGQIKEWMRQGVVEKSNSPHASPLLLVKKKPLSPPLMSDGSPDPTYVAKTRWRTCVDFVQLNAKSAPTDISNAPRVDELLDFIGLAGAHVKKGPDDEYWVSTVDLYAGFNQWYLSDDVKPLTAFTVPGLAAEEGRLQFRVLPFGLASAPTRFNSLVASTIAELRFGHHDAKQETACCTSYIDDIFVAGICTFERHLQDMDKVFQRLQDAGFGARMDKAEFCRNSISMLGWTVAEGYKSAQQSKLESIDKLLDECKDVKDVLSLLGTVGFYRQLIPMAGDIEAPLYDLTRKGAFKPGAWTPVHTACVTLLKHHLKKQVKLAIPRLGCDPDGKAYPPIQLATDASQYAGGAVLFQQQEDGVERPICFASRTFTKEQRNWSATERELWSLMYFATEHFRHYLTANDVILYTDHKPLTYLFTKRNQVNAKLARWSAKLSKLKARVIYRAGAAMGPADTFSRVIKGRPEKEQRDKETPENRNPINHDRGSLAAFEPADTEIRNISLPRKEGIPQQRVTFLKGNTTDEVGEDSDYEDGDEDQIAIKANNMHGRKLTEEQANRLDPQQKESIDKLRKAAMENDIKPEFRVSVGFDVTKAEVAITTDVERIEKRREFENSVTPSKLTGTETREQLFPTTAMVWTTIADKNMNEIFENIEGNGEPGFEEEEFLCMAEEVGEHDLIDLWNTKTGQSYDSELTEVQYMEYKNEKQRLNLYGTQAGGQQGKLPKEYIRTVFDDEEERQAEWKRWSQDLEREDSDYEQEEHDVFKLETDNVKVKEEETFQYKRTEPNREAWKSVRQQVTEITQARLRELSATNDGTMDPAQKDYINALTNPDVTVVVCQGGAGTGKTYTAILTACIAVKEGLLGNIKQTKPLVSTGGVGLGFERGEMADKLKYWCAPAREAMERMNMSDTDRKKVEAFPIDRTRGISVPAGEWMIFDEMQNAPKSLFDAAMTRAEQYGKVVVCGDIKQQDVLTTKGLGMHRFLNAWESLDSRTEAAKEAADKADAKAEESEVNKKEALKIRWEYHRLSQACKAKKSMEQKGATKVIVLDGSRAMRNQQTNNMTSLLDVCQTEEVNSVKQETQQICRKKDIEEFIKTKLDKTVTEGSTLEQEIKETCHQVTEGNSKKMRHAPTFAAYAGMDLLGRGIKKGFPAGKCVGGSEKNSTARLLFRRHYGFEPFRDQQLVPDDAYDKLFLLTATAPCIAFSAAGKQRGQSDKRGQGLHYVDQADPFIKARVPIILFEQVPEASQILEKDWKARQSQKSPQTQLVDKLREGGYKVPDEYGKVDLEEGQENNPGIILNAAEHGGVLDRKRLFTLAIREDLWKHSNADKWFAWPERKQIKRSIKEIFREPVNPQNVATEHMKHGFRSNEKTSINGVQYKYCRDDGLGDWYNPNTVIGEEGRGASITAAGNSRWISFIDIDGAEQWRRLSGVETGKAMGLEGEAMIEFQHLSDPEIHSATGNGVCVEQGEAMGHLINKFWDEDWFYKENNEIQKVEVFRSEGKVEKHTEETGLQDKGADSDYEDIWMNKEDTKKLRESWYQAESEENKEMLIKERTRDRMPKSVRAKEKLELLKAQYEEHINGEKLRFKKRVEDAVNPMTTVSGIERDFSMACTCEADSELTLFEGEICKGEGTNKAVMENKPRLQRISVENNLRQEQLQDPQFGPLIRSLEDELGNSTPQVERLFLRTEQEKYTIHGEQRVLCRITTSERTSSTLRVCVPRSRQDKLLSMCHDNPWACHPTADQMYRMLSLRYYWPQMRAACTLFQQSCDICQRTGYPPKRHAGGRQYVPVSSPFACCAIDVVGPIGNKDSVTKLGNRWIITIIDWFSRYVEAYPVKDTTEETIVKALETFTAKHGIPRRIVSDNASYFRAKTLHHYEKVMGLKHTFVSAYRPQGNGRLERFHRVLGRKIKMSCQEVGHEQWDENLQRICFAHNVVPHSATGYSPYELVYGRLPCTPFDTMTEPQEEHGAMNHKTWMDRVRKANAQSHQIAHEKMADRQQESMDQVAKENKNRAVYQAGEEVLLYIPTIPKGTSKKLKCKWHGPYTVTEVNKGKQVTITMPKGDGGFRDKPVHCGRLKSYKSREKIVPATMEQSLEVFGILEEHEVQTTEDSQMKDGLDVLQREGGREHFTKEGTEIENAKWELIDDGTIRTGIVSDMNLEEEETPIPKEEPSPFDGQQLIEQTICDLTEDDRIIVQECGKCKQTRGVKHACRSCFDEITEGNLKVDLDQYPLFRGNEKEEAGKMGSFKSQCASCTKEIWIPEEQCKCDVTLFTEEQALPGNKQVEYSMQYPVILQEGQTRPRIYQGRKGLPPLKEVELWQKVEKKVSECNPNTTQKGISEQSKEIEQTSASVTKKTKVYETRAIQGYNQWQGKYTVAWKGDHPTTMQTIQDCMASTGLIEEYWSDPQSKGGVKKWQKLRPATDNLAQTLRTLTSVQAMTRQEICVAGVQVHQAVGNNIEQVYTRLQAHDIRSNDVFTVILDIQISGPMNKNETKKQEKIQAGEDSDEILCKCSHQCSGGDTRKLYMPVRWTWNRLQKVCTKQQKEQIRSQLSTAAKVKSHTCWMKGYLKCKKLGADEQNGKDIIVISKTEMIACVQQAGQEWEEIYQQQEVDQWARNSYHPQLQKRMCSMIAIVEWSSAVISEEETMNTSELHQAPETVYQAEGEDATHHSNELHQTPEMAYQACPFGAGQQSNELHQTQEMVYQAEGEDATHHSNKQVESPVIKYALAPVPVAEYEAALDRQGTPEALLSDEVILSHAISRGIEGQMANKLHHIGKEEEVIGQVAECHSSITQQQGVSQQLIQGVDQGLLDAQSKLAATQQYVSESLWNAQQPELHKEGQLHVTDTLQQQTAEAMEQVKEHEHEEIVETRELNTTTTQREIDFEFGSTTDKGEAMQPADIGLNIEKGTEVQRVHELETQWEKTGCARNIDAEIHCFKEERRRVLKGSHETVTISQVREALRKKRRHRFEAEDTMNHTEEVVCNREIKELIHQHEVLTVQEMQANRESLGHQEKARWKRHEITALRAERSLDDAGVMQELEALKEEELSHMKACQRWEELKEVQENDNTASYIGEVKMQRLEHKVVKLKSQGGIARERRECEEAGNRNLREASQNYMDMLRTGDAEIVSDAMITMKVIARHNRIDRLNSDNTITETEEFLCLTEEVKHTVTDQ